MAGPEITCSGCGRAITEGAHRWAGREPEEYWHYGCAENARLAHRTGSPAAADPPLMFSHERVWGAIESLADMRQLSLTALALLAGLDPTALHRSKRFGADGKPRWPSSRTIAQLLEATGTSFVAFGALVEPPDRPRAGEARADILLVEESDAARDSYATVLRSAGYRVHGAAGESEVCALLDGGEPIDLLCTDLAVPHGLGGVALARLVRARRPALRVLYITGYDVPTITGALRKPVAPEQLLDAVEQALAGATTLFPEPRGAAH